MTQSKVIKHAHDGGSYTLKDGAAATLVVRFDSADLSISGLTPKLRETAHYEGRGKRRSSRYGKRKYPTLTFSCQVANLSESTTGEATDFIFRRAPFTANVSTDDLGDVHTINFVYNQAGAAGEPDEQIELYKLNVTEVGFSEGEPNKWTITAEVLGTIVVNEDVLALAPEDD